LRYADSDPLVSGLPLSTRPSVSLVIAATTGDAYCRAAIAAVLPVCREWEVEVLLVRRASSTEAPPAGVTVVPAPESELPEGYPSLGLLVARGDLVLLTTDVDAPNLDWNEILLHRLGKVAQADVEPSAHLGEAAPEAGNHGG
jgi:hypothetical protein